jgi:hypothetical protein
MNKIGIICYLLSFALCLWSDWRIAVSIISFYIAFKIEMYDYSELSNNKKP